MTKGLHFPRPINILALDSYLDWNPNLTLTSYLTFHCLCFCLQNGYYYAKSWDLKNQMILMHLKNLVELSPWHIVKWIKAIPRFWPPFSQMYSGLVKCQGISLVVHRNVSEFTNSGIPCQLGVILAISWRLATFPILADSQFFLSSKPLIFLNQLVKVAFSWRKVTQWNFLHCLIWDKVK